ncbi:MAG: flagellar basal-body rod protein FlgG [Pseudomonadota bacterium]
MRALKIAATGMEAQATRVEVISNNIANMSTTAYQTRRAEFADLHYQQVETPGSLTSTAGTVLAAGVQLGLGVRTSAVSMNVSQGSLEQTGAELDFAIQGKGYFEVSLPSGDTAFTRDGSFKRTADGVIVTVDGYEISGGITIPEDTKRVEANAEGELFAYFEGEVQPQSIGQLTLATFTNVKGLEAIGSNLFLETPASGAPVSGSPGIDGAGLLNQGYLESSSVDVVNEITDLIEAQRGYEMNSKVVTAADQMLAATTQIR